ncbi:hypothetical protein HLA87_02540 [Mycoplasma miroungigenitalium]|uniref:Uncharacterized protein n=1 Tax=Mycoplasma miroungigenitalium TaxID=754515 RepID=A0A6M4JEZ9_9MOLU|nr:adenine-specific methyltransferase EcoRI family protein [Mycoplasma miroungigenitalium]QJR43652.1 hypothetical protein HLA87_02540 [Mycoplasma miroungigenitalium]
MVENINNKKVITLTELIKEFEVENKKQKGHTVLTNAKRKANDEFYTTIEPIENEMEFWAKQDAFRGRSILLPCDPLDLFDGLVEGLKHSQFWVYFHKNFERLGLKSLRATCLTFGELKNAKFYEYKGGDDNNLDAYIEYSVESDGDFNDPKLHPEFLKSDLVITNPPFSKLRLFLNVLTDLKLDFLIIAPQTIIKSFKFLTNYKNKHWFLGHTSVKPVFVDARSTREKLGKVVKGGPNCIWITSLKSILKSKRVKKNDISFSTFDFYPDIINIDRFNDLNLAVEIYGKNQLYGVPISALVNDNFNEKWELLCCISECICDDKKHNKRAFVNGVQKFPRLIIKAKN